MALWWKLWEVPKKIETSKGFVRQGRNWVNREGERSLVKFLKDMFGTDTV